MACTNENPFTHPLAASLHNLFFVAAGEAVLGLLATVFFFLSGSVEEHEHKASSGPLRSAPAKAAKGKPFSLLHAVPPSGSVSV